MIKIEYIDKRVLKLIKPLNIEILSAAHALMKYSERLPWFAGGGYNPYNDFIFLNENCLVKPEQNDSVAHSTEVFLHELIHWTGHSTRLARQTVVSYETFNRSPITTQDLAQEEYTAIFGSLKLHELLGLDTTYSLRSINIYKKNMPCDDHDSANHAANKAIVFLSKQLKLKKVA